MRRGVLPPLVTPAARMAGPTAPFAESFDTEPPVGANTLLGDPCVPEFLSGSDLGSAELVLPPPPIPPIAQKPSDEAPMPELIDGRYEMHEELAVGGMSRVFRAFDRSLNRDIALKVLRSRFMQKDEVALRFVEEARVTARLQHPGIVPVYETGKLRDGRPYIAMKLVHGRTLKDLLAARSTPQQDRAHFISIFEQVCQTMAYCHSRGVLHRDLKPENIMVGAFGEAQVMDWGLAKTYDPNGACIDPSQLGGNLSYLSEYKGENPSEAIEDTKIVRVHVAHGMDGATEAGQILGTFQYMPPEQALGETDRLDFRSDVFALGAIMCQILTGKPPYSLQRAEARRQARGAELGPAFAEMDKSGGDLELVALAKRCLNPVQAERPRDAGALALEVAAYLRGVQERLHDELVRQVAADANVRTRLHAEAAARTVKRTFTASGLAIVALLSIASFVALYYRGQRDALASVEEGKRQARTQWIESGLKEADGQVRRAWGAPGPPDEWRNQLDLADKTMQNIRQLVAQDPEPGQYFDRLAALAKTAARSRGEYELLLRLDRLRLEDTDSHPDLNRASQLGVEYAQAFNASELAPLADATGAALARLEASPAKAKFLVQCLNWLTATSNAAERQRLSEMLASSLPASVGLSDWLAAAEAKEFEKMRSLAEKMAAAGIDPDMAVVLGAHARRVGADEAAEILLKDGLARGADPFHAHRELGFICRNAPEKRAEAIRHLSAAQALRPGWAFPHVDLALALSKDRRTIEALDQLRQAVKVEPDCVPAWWHLAGLQRDTGRYADAVKSFRELLKDPARLGRDMRGKARIAASMAAVRASLTGGADAAALRKQAGDWLLEHRAQFEREPHPSDRSVLSQWRTDQKFAPIRDAEFLDAMPAAEKAEWEAVWKQVDATLAAMP